MANKNKYITEMQKGFEEKGLKITETTSTGKGHLKVFFIDAMGREASVICSRNPSDNQKRVIKNSITHARQALNGPRRDQQ